MALLDFYSFALQCPMALLGLKMFKTFYVILYVICTSNNTYFHQASHSTDLSCTAIVILQVLNIQKKSLAVGGASIHCCHGHKKCSIILNFFLSQVLMVFTAPECNFHKLKSHLIHNIYFINV